MAEKRDGDWHTKPPTKVRSVEQAIALAEQQRADLPHVVQVFARDWDRVILADELAKAKAQLGRLVKLGAEELKRGALHSNPRKFDFARERGMSGLDEVHDWMLKTRSDFEMAINEALAAIGEKT